MGSQKCGLVGKSQSVLIMINPIIFTRTRTWLAVVVLQARPALDCCRPLAPRSPALAARPVDSSVDKAAAAAAAGRPRGPRGGVGAVATVACHISQGRLICQRRVR
jgi:hypothetical protein